MTSSPTIFLSREALRLGSERELRRRHSAGNYHRVATGVYMDRDEWDALGTDDRYRVRVRAAALRSAPCAQFSHDSAAALHRLPSNGPWPATVHELVERGPGGTSRRDIRRHGLGRDPAPVTIDGVTVTSLARTLVDIAASAPLMRSVPMLDDGLRQPREGDLRWALGQPVPTKPELLRLLESLQPYPAPTRALHAVEFADALSGSVAESIARLQFHALGLPAPELQVQFFDELGSIGFVDFYWRELDLIIEVDGRSKYGDARRYQRGLSGEQILWNEKRREDRLRRVATAFGRLDWETVNDRRRLAAHVAPFGLRA
jgi:hypothetical protein